MFILWRTKSKLFSVARRLAFLFEDTLESSQLRDSELRSRAAKLSHPGY